MNLTDKQFEIVQFIKDYLDENSYPPSVREICVAVGLKSTSSVHSHLEKLEKKGVIRRDSLKTRAIEITYDEFLPSSKIVNRNDIIDVPIIGKVTAGEPILAVENIEDTFPLPVSFAKNSDEIFMLSIKGLSMKDAGILDSDLVIVRQQATAENGDIVVALIDEGATVKRFFKDGNKIRLQPENSSMEPIYVTNGTFTILGIVIGVFRRLS